MHYKKFNNKVMVRIDRGEEIVESLKKICKKLNINLGTITGIGATNKATIGLYDVNSKKYNSKNITGDHEIAPLIGNITSMNDEIYVHLHVNLCDIENKSYGGHLDFAIVSATFEGIIDIIEGKIDRTYDEKIGLNLLDI